MFHLKNNNIGYKKCFILVFLLLLQEQHFIVLYDALSLYILIISGEKGQGFVMCKTLNIIDNEKTFMYISFYLTKIQYTYRVVIIYVNCLFLTVEVLRYKISCQIFYLNYLNSDFSMKK